MSRDEFICPVCGATVPARAKVCPDCGSDEKTGWSDQTIYDGTDIEDPDEFDYERWKRRELGKGQRPGGRQWLWWGTALALLGLLAWLLIFARGVSR